MRADRCLLLSQGRSLLLRQDRCLLLRQDRCLLLRQDRCIVLRHLSCLNSRHLSCLNKRHLALNHQKWPEIGPESLPGPENRPRACRGHFLAFGIGPAAPNRQNIVQTPDQPPPAAATCLDCQSVCLGLSIRLCVEHRSTLCRNPLLQMTCACTIEPGNLQNGH